jgi:hypothetical protein
LIALQRPQPWCIGSVPLMICTALTKIWRRCLLNTPGVALPSLCKPTPSCACSPGRPQTWWLCMNMSRMSAKGPGGVARCLHGRSDHGGKRARRRQSEAGAGAEGRGSTGSVRLAASRGTPVTPDVRLYHRAVVVAQEATGGFPHRSELLWRGSATPNKGVTRGRTKRTKKNYRVGNISCIVIK